MIIQNLLWITIAVFFYTITNLFVFDIISLKTMVVLYFSALYHIAIVSLIMSIGD